MYWILLYIHYDGLVHQAHLVWPKLGLWHCLCRTWHHHLYWKYVKVRARFDNGGYVFVYLFFSKIPNQNTYPILIIKWSVPKLRMEQYKYDFFTGVYVESEIQISDYIQVYEKIMDFKNIVHNDLVLMANQCHTFY